MVVCCYACEGVFLADWDGGVRRDGRGCHVEVRTVSM